MSSEPIKPKIKIIIKPKLIAQPESEQIPHPVPEKEMKTMLVCPARVQLKKVKGVIQSPFDTYIGRRINNPNWRMPGSIWANPFAMSSESQRSEVVDKFRAHLKSSPDLLSQLPTLSGKKIGCFCPLDKKCHADVIIECFKEHVATK
jgi:hypothetical protein